MLIDQRFERLRRAVDNYSELCQRNKLKARHDIILTSCICFVMPFSLFSLVVLYHHHELFKLIFSGEYKLFTTNVPITFSIALIIVIPSFILLFFLIYKICAIRNINNQFMDTTDDLMRATKSVCMALKDKLDENVGSIDLLTAGYMRLEGKYNAFLAERDDHFKELDAQCLRLEQLVNSTTSAMTHNLSRVQSIVEDVRKRIDELSVCHAKFMDSLSELQQFIKTTLESEALGLQNRVRFLQDLQANLSKDIDLCAVERAIKVIVAKIEAKIPKPQKFVRSSIQRSLWVLSCDLLKALENINGNSNSTYIAFSQSLINMLHKFLDDFYVKIINHDGPDKKALVDIGGVEVPLLQIHLLRFLAGRRSAILAETCESVKSFLNDEAADRCKPEVLVSSSLSGCNVNDNPPVSENASTSVSYIQDLSMLGAVGGEGCNLSHPSLP